MSHTHPLFTLSGKTALITGAGSPDGIGFATAALLAQLGCRVALTATGSNAANRALVARSPLTLAGTLTRPQEELLYDPQTSGGLLLALPGSQAGELLRQLHAAGIHEAAQIGDIISGAPGISVQ